MLGSIPGRVKSILLLIALSACAARQVLLPDESVPLPAAALAGPAAPLAPRARDWVEATLDRLTLPQKVGQLFNVWISGGYVSTDSAEFDTLVSWVEDLGLSGVTISIGLPHGYAAKLNALQERAPVPLLVTADMEAGPGMRLSGSYAIPSLLAQGGGTSFPPLMALGAARDERLAFELGRVTGVEARAVGVHLVFAPVLDVNTDPGNPIINTRSFGEDPKLVARLGAAFIEGAHAAGLQATAKHFPGHGDTDVDSHLELPVIDATRTRLDSIELVPFRRAIKAGVDAVMSAHVAAPEILGPDAPPATLSDYFLTRLLREEMGFEGLVFTDAMTMGAIQRGYGGGEAAVRAILAGADVVLSPPDLGAAFQAVVAAVREGQISEERLDRSVRRMLEAKARAGLHLERTVPFERVAGVVGSRAHQALADTAATRAITLIRDRDQLVPIPAGRRGSVLAIAYADPVNVVAGRVFHRALAEAVDSLKTTRVDEETSSGRYGALAASADSADLVVVSVHVRPESGAGTVGVPDSFRAFVADLLERHAPVVLVSFGSPYLLDAWPGAGTYLIAWGGQPILQRAAARALLGEADITGRLPVSLPPHHAAGEGLVRRAGRAPPETVGLDSRRLARVDSLLKAAIADSVTAGAALAIGRHGRLVRLEGYGSLDWGGTGAAVTDSTLYDLASLTKAVGTTTAIMALVEEDRLQLAAPVSRYLAWFTGGGKEEVSVRQLLLHRSGLPAWLPLWQEHAGRDGYREALAALELSRAPGDSTVYSDLGFIVLGFLVEAVTDKPLDGFLAERVFEPLGMRETMFRPPPFLLPRIAPTEIDTVFRHQHVHGMVHDENAYALGGVAGHAGLFSSARDLARYAEALLDARRAGEPGEHDDAVTARVFDPVTVRRFTLRHDSTSSRALGWDTPDEDSSAGRFLSPSAFGHTGFTGTSLWIDPELDLFVVLLTNRVNPTREQEGHVALRRAVHEAVACAVVDRPPCEPGTAPGQGRAAP
ncbi:MAG: glycoside hydrolase family 3 N-terminal domain-containing protein [Gemmatimonadota bacterium]